MDIAKTHFSCFFLGDCNSEMSGIKDMCGVKSIQIVLGTIDRK